MTTASLTTNIAACALEANNTQVISYIGSDERIYQLVWQNGSWLSVDVMANWKDTLSITLPHPLPAGPLSISPLEPYKTSYVFYIDNTGNNKGNIWALSLPIVQGATVPHGGSLQEALNPNLTQRTGAPSVANNSGLASFAWKNQKSEHVVFLGNDGDVWELYWTIGTADPVHGGPLWQKNNLSAQTGYTQALAPRPGSPLCGYVFENEGTEHVIYIAKDGTIKELYHSGGHWAGNNLSEAADALQVLPASNSLTCYACEYENTQHVMYIGFDRNIHEIYNSGGWRSVQNLNEITGTPSPAGNSVLTGYACEYEHTEHVIYIDADSNIQEIYRSGNSWYNTTLSSAAGSGAPPPISTASPLSGYSFENQRTEHVVYVDANQEIHELYRSGDSWYAGEVSKP